MAQAGMGGVGGHSCQLWSSLDGGIQGDKVISPFSLRFPLFGYHFSQNSDLENQSSGELKTGQWAWVVWPEPAAAAGQHLLLPHTLPPPFALGTHWAPSMGKDTPHNHCTIPLQEAQH